MKQIPENTGSLAIEIPFLQQNPVEVEETRAAGEGAGGRPEEEKRKKADKAR